MLWSELSFDACLTPLRGDGGHLSVLDIVRNSNEARPNTVFVALRGAHVDGHAYVKSAYDRGCRLFVVEEEVSLPPDAFLYLAKDTRIALASLSCAFFGHPAKDMTVIGITGTKGKTTTAWMIARLLCGQGISCAYIGSNGIDYGGHHFDTPNTTPESYVLQSHFRAMRDQGITVAVMEVSSQAVKMHRVDGISFSVGIFTNLAHDHIGAGEHPDFEDYRACKARFFSDYGCRTMIYCADDGNASAMLEHASASRRISVSLRGTADYFAEDTRSFLGDGVLGVSFSLCEAHGNEKNTVTLRMAGEFNAANALLAYAACRTVAPQVKDSAWREALSEVSVDGRCQVVPIPSMPDRCFVIDYAHNGYSLSSILRLLRNYAPKRLICLVGSVGGRSFDRREELGSVGSTLADLLILTSDNPGEEDPRKILEEMYRAAGARRDKVKCIVDRAEAIAYAVELSQAGDIVLLAGKGHETYQLIGKEKLPFSEKDLLTLYADSSPQKKDTSADALLRQRQTAEV